MDIFNPIVASKNIKDEFNDYIMTLFNISDKEYSSQLKAALDEDGTVTKGPFLDISGSYQTSESIEDLIKNGEASPLFRTLERSSEKDKELKIERPLYSHQVQSLKCAESGSSMVVTTGTGSGKTECFLIPVINSLLREKEAGTLDDGVRAIIIYPMNALANDQIKRMRRLFADFPDIKFGLYNGNTRQTQEDAVRDYRKTNRRDALPNEMISREKMREHPPHILVTNYSMLEYMMLRPNDDKVFSGAKLKYIVLDEAHIYKGTTGMETAMLMRRLWARISSRDTVQYILTSATLGGKEDDSQIVHFAENLCCGKKFLPENIIRSIDATPAMIEELDFPVELFSELSAERVPVAHTLKKYGIEDYSPAGDNYEKIYCLLLHSRLFSQLIEETRKPVSVYSLSEKLKITGAQLVDFIDVCTKAEKEKTSLIKAKYHFFVRALEGAYGTLIEPKKLFLQRKTAITENGTDTAVFELAICSDCGRMAIVGRINTDGILTQVSRKRYSATTEYDYFMISDEGFKDLFCFDDTEADDEDYQAAETGENDYVICPRCARIEHKSELHFGRFCSCEDTKYISLVKVPQKDKKTVKCPACGFGTIRSFYLGYDSATAVLGTELFEQLPDEECIIADVGADTPTEAFDDLFSGLDTQAPAVVMRKRMRQFLTFSDSRAEAAFFANYMEKGYQEFLRRRGILTIISRLRSGGETLISVGAFVELLTRYFDENKTFEVWNPDAGRIGTDDADKMHVRNKSQAWVAVLNEMFNARRSTSIPALGYCSFEYKKNDGFSQRFAEKYHMDPAAAKNLMNLLVMDMVYVGAVSPGTDFSLTPAELDYIFFSEKGKRMVLRKTAENTKLAHLGAWSGRKRENGKYYPNMRMQRLVDLDGGAFTPESADNFLSQYWKSIFNPQMEEYVLNGNDFNIRLYGDPELKFYRCRKCGRITPYNVNNRCASIKCGGTLAEVDPEEYSIGNHYRNLYTSPISESLQIKEHTAQLSKDRQAIYQQAFVDKKINALSCSTTFEMGIDVGTLETVYMRDIPPSPANYVQRAGRAGRALHTAAFILTYAKLSSHDFTFFQSPEKIISGSIKAPVFTVENDKVVLRHIYAVALSSFFANYQEVYNNDDADVFLNQNGYETLKEYLRSKPDALKLILTRSIPPVMHDRIGIDDFKWVDCLIGDEGTLELAVRGYHEEVRNLQKEISRVIKEGNLGAATKLDRELKILRNGSDDGIRGKKSLIGFLVRNNALPKYGFPVDTVELQDSNAYSGDKHREDDAIQLNRDLQMAIAEYAPGAEVIADGKLFTSRYIRKHPGRSSSWETGYYCECPNCREPNMTRSLTDVGGNPECISCGRPINRTYWQKTLEPRSGFMTEGKPKDVPLRKPERDFKTEDHYIGDAYYLPLMKRKFSVDGLDIELESTANDSLAVVGLNKYYVCPICGYASEDAIGSHDNNRGFKCSLEGSASGPYRLSHTFRTDVAKIKFCTVDAQDKGVMYSVMYALLEGLSRSLDIERTDIKGCLHQVTWEGSQNPIYSVVLYDSVAGGAGHVRRMVTENADVFRQVIRSAIEVVSKCKCDTSCYYCLRNYYNQNYHDILDRNAALLFLKKWTGEFQAVESTASEQPLAIKTDSRKYTLEYPDWEQFADVFMLTFDACEWDRRGISRDCYSLGEFTDNSGTSIQFLFAWPERKIAVFDSSNISNTHLLEELGWKCFDIDNCGEELLSALVA